MEVYYNGVDTIVEKTRYARENLGGVMIWELVGPAIHGEPVSGMTLPGTGVPDS